MQVFRFMSKEEFKKFNNGEVLYNNRVHNAKCTSKGFCFFDLNDYKPHNAMHFLSGIVSFDICAVFETDKRNLKERYGVYSKRNTMLIPCIFPSVGAVSKFHATEYCTTEYSNKDFKLIKFSKDIWGQYDVLENQKDLNWIKIEREENVNENRRLL